MAISQRISIKDMAFYLGANRIGGAEEGTFIVTADNEEAFEADNYFAVEITDGKKHISGTVTKAFLDVDILKDICPMDGDGLWPEFTMTAVQTKKTPIRNITVTGLKFDGFEISELTTDGHSKNPLPWKATGLSFK